METAIVDELKAYLGGTRPEQRLADVRIGLGYTAVMLEDGNVGVAYTFRDKAAAGCSVFHGERPLAGRTTVEALEYLGSTDLVEGTVGLAVANAIVNRPAPCQQQGDILEVLTIRPTDQVGMVGYFGPLVGPLRGQVRRLTIFEHAAAFSEDVLPAEQAPQQLPGCDVAIITSTALILGELDRLLEASSGCREVAVVGASTPLLPQVFGHRGVTLLSGIVVTDPPAILQIVSEGGGMGFFGGRVSKVNVRV